MARLSLHGHMKHDASLTEGPIAAALIRLAIPIIGANILQTAYQVTDTFWVGRLSAQAVAAVSLCFPLNFLMIAIGGGLPIAGSVLIAQYKGRRDKKAVSHVAAQTLLMVLAVSLILTAGGYFCSEPIIRFMGAAPDVLPDAVRFLQVTFLGFFFVFGFFVYQSLMRGLGVVYTPMFIVLLTVLLNLALDPLLIFGYGPVPALGVAGAAWATFCTQALATCIGFALLLGGRHGIRLRPANFRPDFALIARAFRLGMPTSLEQSTRALGMTMMTVLASSFGTIAVAAYGTGVRVMTCVIIPALGLSLAVSTVVAQNIGAGRVDRAERAAWIGCGLAFLSLQAAGVVFFFAARPLAALFVPESGEAIELSAEFLRIVAVTFGCIGVQQVVAGTLRGAGNTLAAMVLAMTAQWVLLFPLAYLLSKHSGLGLSGIWWAIAASNVVGSIVALAWFLRGDWKRKRLLEEIKLQQQIGIEIAVEEGLPS